MAQDLAEKLRGLGAIFATSTLPNPAHRSGGIATTGQRGFPGPVGRQDHKGFVPNNYTMMVPGFSISGFPCRIKALRSGRRGVFLSNLGA